AVAISNPPSGGGRSNTSFFTVRQAFSQSSFDANALVSGSDPPATAIEAIDVNNDLAVDLVGSGLSSVSVFLGDGSGQFGEPTDYAAGLPGPVVCGDFNNDGILDLAYVDQAKGLSAL